jgi:Cdc6-like AAA superfamily ATPase
MTEILLSQQELNEVANDIQGKIKRTDSNFKSRGVNFPLFVRECLHRVGEACTWDIYSTYNELCKLLEYKKIQYSSACRYMYILNREGLIEKTKKVKSDTGKWEKQLYRLLDDKSPMWQDITVWRA